MQVSETMGKHHKRKWELGKRAGIEHGMAKEIIPSPFESKSWRNHDVQQRTHVMLNRLITPQTHSLRCVTACQLWNLLVFLTCKLHTELLKVAGLANFAGIFSSLASKKCLLFHTMGTMQHIVAISWGQTNVTFLSCRHVAHVLLYR